MNERPAKLTIILGTNGTGKTTLLENVLLNSDQKSLVVTPNDIEWQNYEAVDLNTASDFNYTGIRRHIFNPDKKNGTLTRLEYFKRGVLVFDDCRAYLGAQTDERIRQLIICRRHRMIDVFAVGHGFTEVPPVFFTFATDIILFRTTDNIIRRKNFLKDFELMERAQHRVNQKTKTETHYCEHIKFV
jgi:ABC-type Mn2+/Zn2+ transport system ATPase subunit